MRKLITTVQLALSLAIIVSVVSCGDKDEEPSASLAFDGSYNGIFSMQGVQIGTWTMLVHKGQASGSFDYITGSTAYTGTVYEGGKLEVNITYDDGSTTETVITIKEDGVVSGTWANSDVEFGELSGAIEVTSFDGSYNGIAFSDDMYSASWSLTISKGKATGSYSGGDGNGLISGYVDGDGKLSIGSAFATGTVLTAQGSIADGDVTVVWFDTTQESGTAVGAIATGAFDNDYEGTALGGGVVIGTWTLNIASGKAMGVYNGSDDSSAINGFANEDGDIYLGINQGDGDVVTVTGTIEGGDIAGSWTDSDGRSGTFVGGI